MAALLKLLFFVFNISFLPKYRVKYYDYMGKAHKNCIIGQKFCLHHITGTAFIIRLKLNVYIVENSDTFQKIYSFMQFK